MMRLAAAIMSSCVNLRLDAFSFGLSLSSSDVHAET